MQSLVSIASKAVATYCPIERVYDLPVELREHVQLYFDKSTQLEYFESWTFDWMYNNEKYLIKVIYQGAYTTILVYRNFNFGAELNLYNNQFHGLNRIAYDDGVEKQYIYKLGVLISTMETHSDGSIFRTVDYSRAYHELISFEPGGNGKIKDYLYYSRARKSYITLIFNGENVPAIGAGEIIPSIKNHKWVLRLMDACGIYLEI